MRLSRNVEYGGSVNKHALILHLKFPVNVEPLRHLQPVLNRNVVRFVELCLAVYVEGFGNGWRIGRSYQFVEQSRAVRDGEEEGSDMFIVFNLSNFVVFGHCERVVDNFILCLAVGIDIDELLASEVVVFSFSANRPLYLPSLSSWILEYDLLSHLLSDRALEFQLLDSFLRLRYALADQIDIERVCSLNRTFHLESDIVVRHVRMESDVEVQVLVGQKISLLWLDRKVFIAESGIPLEFRSDIAEIRQLDCLAYLGVDHHCSEADSILHQFHLYPVSSCINVQQFLLFLVLYYLVAELSLKSIDPRSGLEANLHLCLFPRVNCDGIAGNYLDKLLLQFLYLAVDVKSYLYLFLRVIDQTDRPRRLRTDMRHPEIDVLVFSFFKL